MLPTTSRSLQGSHASPRRWRRTALALAWATIVATPAMAQLGAADLRTSPSFEAPSFTLRPATAVRALTSRTAGAAASASCRDRDEKSLAILPPVDSSSPEWSRIPLVLFREGFEGIFPSGLWEVFDYNGSDYGEYFWDDDDTLADTGGYWSAWPANGGADGLDPYDNYYPNNLDSWMVYGPFDLSDATAAVMSFRLWFQTEPGYDEFSWYSSADGINFYGWGVSGDSGGWDDASLDLTDRLGDPTVWVLFRFTSDSSYVDDGAFVDNIEIVENYGPGPWLQGQTITAAWRYPTFGAIMESHAVVVTPTLELGTADIVYSNSFTIDFGPSSIRFSFVAESAWTPMAFNGWTFTDTFDVIPPFAGIEIAAAQGVAGLGSVALGFDPNTVWADFGGISVQAGDFIELRIVFDLFSDGFEIGSTGNWSTTLP